MSSLVQLGRWEELEGAVRERLRLLPDDLAWLAVLRGAVDRQALADAQRAVQLSDQNRRAPSTFTLAQRRLASLSVDEAKGR